MSEWIPYPEYMPEDGKRVLWCFKDGFINIERYKCDAIDHFYPQQGQHDLEEAVAWMPLPEPYNPEQDSFKEMVVRHLGIAGSALADISQSLTIIADNLNGVGSARHD